MSRHNQDTKPLKSTDQTDSKKTLTQRASDKLAADNERGARQVLIEDLFYDFHRSRQQVYMMNFWRGVFFGCGSVLGATLLVTSLIWAFGQLVDIFPALADFLNTLVDTMQRRR